MKSQKLFILLSVLIGSMILAACSDGQAEEPETLTPVDLSLSFRPDVQFAPMYVGIEQGIFEKHGFDVTITHRYESESAKLVATDTAGDEVFDVAVIGGDQHLLARAQELPIVFVFEWFQQYPIAIASLDSSTITEPAGLAGHSVGVPMLEGASYLGLQALLSSGGLTEDDIDLQATGFTQVETLVTEQVEAVVVYSNNEPIQLEAQGVPVNVLNVSDFADMVSNGVIVSESRISDDPELVSEFVAAFSEALAFTLENPDTAFENSIVHVEGLDDPDVESTAREVLAWTLPLWEADQLGYSDRGAWEFTQQMLVQAGLLESEIDLDSAFTNEFLP